MIKNIIIGVVVASVLGVLSFNGWKWQIDAVAAEQIVMSTRLQAQYINDVESEVYDLEKIKDIGLDWTDRDEKRLKRLLSILEKEGVGQ